MSIGGLTQGVSISQTASNKRMTVTEVYEYCEANALVPTEFNYPDPRLERGTHTPDLPEAVARTIDPRMREQQATASPESMAQYRAEMGDDEVEGGIDASTSLEDEIMFYSNQGRKPSEVAKALGDADVSIQKVVAVKRRYASHPEEFNVPKGS